MQTCRFTMAVSRLALVMSIALGGTAALAVSQDTNEHTAHHPAGVSSAVKTMPVKTEAVKTGKGMGMMGDMKSMPMPGKLPADMAARHQMMEKRMEMM